MTLKQRTGRFLEELNRFVVAKVNRNGFEETVLGKCFAVAVEGEELALGICFSEGSVPAPMAPGEANKTMTIEAGLLWRVLSGALLFENLYTGYTARFDRIQRRLRQDDAGAALADLVDEGAELHQLRHRVGTQDQAPSLTEASPLRSGHTVAGNRLEDVEQALETDANIRSGDRRDKII